MTSAKLSAGRLSVFTDDVNLVVHQPIVLRVSSGAWDDARWCHRPHAVILSVHSQHILSLNWDHVLSYVTIGWLRADSHVQLTKTTKNMVLFTPDILYRRNCFFLNLWNFANGPWWKRWHICCYFESDLCRQHKQPCSGSALAAAVTYLCRTKPAAPVSRQIS